MSKTKYDYITLKKELSQRIINVEKPYRVFVPDRPATFGHLIVVSWKGYEDISDVDLVEDINHQKEIMEVLCKLASEMKKSLTSNGKKNGKKCEKVYVVSECETEAFPFHFHLIPRFEGDSKGHEFFFEKELEEARWMLKNEKKEDKICDGRKRIKSMKDILHSHDELIQSSGWARTDKDRIKFIKRIKAKIEEILN